MVMGRSGSLLRLDERIERSLLHSGGLEVDGDSGELGRWINLAGIVLSARERVIASLKNHHRGIVDLLGDAILRDGLRL